MWVVICETVIICFILFSAITGQLYKSESEANNRKKIDSSLSSIPIHNDTTVSRAKEDIIRSDSSKMQALADTVNDLKRLIENQRKVIEAGRKPDVDVSRVWPVNNPLITQHGISATGIDTLFVKVVYTNTGSSSAFWFHVKTNDLLVREDSSIVTSSHGVDSYFDNYKMRTGVENSLETNNSITFKNNPQAVLWHCIAFCYKDSLNRTYGPFYHQFKWHLNALNAPGRFLTTWESKRAEQELQKVGQWPTMFF